ncbi:hypothetical protein LY78DRAFT_649557 [Colletotrichum sublineola]|nr:hypothetical protein LY78DRAFT_649557 [Colletotrichum sublineola]
MSTVNIVKYYFHKANIPRTEARMRQLIALAYQIARDKELYPQAVFVCEVHLTTIINSRRQKDPQGAYMTFSYKSQDHLGRETHVACHGYVKDLETLEFKEATHADKKPDLTKKQSGKAVWPGAAQLWEAPEVGYGHMPEK